MRRDKKDIPVDPPPSSPEAKARVKEKEELMTAGVCKFFFWSKKHFQCIREVLGMHRLPHEVKHVLQEAHRCFAIHLNTDISRLSKVRRQLERISKVLADYKDIDGLTEQVLILALPHTPCPSIADLNRDLRKLHERAVIALKNIPPKDRPGPHQKEWPLRTLIGALKDIYEKSTGKKATIIKSKESKMQKHNTPRGPFFEFVTEFLQIIGYKPHSNIALSRTMDQVIYPPSSTKTTELM
jgi:hypothetical protein